MSAHRHGRIVGVVAVVPLVLLGTGMLFPVQASSFQKRPATNPIYIGQLVSLTGAFSGSALPPAYWKVGARLAVDDVNVHGGVHGRRLKLLYADAGSTTDSSGDIAAFQRLTASRRVSAILAGNSSPKVQALSPFIRRADIPVIIGGQAPILTHEGNPWVFRTRVNQRIEERVLATFAVSTLHLTKFALIHTDNDAGKEAGALLQRNLMKLGSAPVIDLTVPSPASDLTAQVLAVKKSGAEALISVFTDDSAYVLLARQMSQAGVHVIWLGNPVMSDERVRQQGGALFYGTYAATDFVAGQSPEAAAFDRLSKRVFHLAGNHDSSYAYDGVQILARVMRKVGTDPRAIRRGILAMHGYRGVEGTYNFDRNGDGLHQETIVQNVQGRLRVVKVLSF